jgi:hypothetical protein
MSEERGRYRNAEEGDGAGNRDVERELEKEIEACAGDKRRELLRRYVQRNPGRVSQMETYFHDLPQTAQAEIYFVKTAEERGALEAYLLESTGLRREVAVKCMVKSVDVEKSVRVMGLLSSEDTEWISEKLAGVLEVSVEYTDQYDRALVTIIMAMHRRHGGNIEKYFRGVASHLNDRRTSFRERGIILSYGLLRPGEGRREIRTYSEFAYFEEFFEARAEVEEDSGMSAEEECSEPGVLLSLDEALDFLDSEKYRGLSVPEREDVWQNVCDLIPFETRRGLERNCGGLLERVYYEVGSGSEMLSLLERVSRRVLTFGEVGPLLLQNLLCKGKYSLRGRLFFVRVLELSLGEMRRTDVEEMRKRLLRMDLDRADLPLYRHGMHVLRESVEKRLG